MTEGQRTKEIDMTSPSEKGPDVANDTTAEDGEPMVSIPVRLARDPELSDRALRVFAVVASHVQQGDPVLTCAAIGEESGHSHRAVRQALNILVPRCLTEKYPDDYPEWFPGYDDGYNGDPPLTFALPVIPTWFAVDEVTA